MNERKHIEELTKKAAAELAEALGTSKKEASARQSYVEDNPDEQTAAEKLASMLRPIIDEKRARNDEFEGIEHDEAVINDDGSFELSSEEGQTWDMDDKEASDDESEKDAHDRPDGAQGPDTNDTPEDHVPTQTGPEASTETEPEKIANMLWDLLSTDEYVQAGFKSALEERSEDIYKSAIAILNK